jgi:hypothetical protein
MFFSTLLPAVLLALRLFGGYFTGYRKNLYPGDFPMIAK